MPPLLPLSLQRRSHARIRPDLEALARALDELGRPQDRLHSVLVVGSNGKGSTAAMTEAVLRASGTRCGLYTSPHLVRVEERIRVAGDPVDRGTFERHLAVLDHHELTFFEILTAAALLVFAEAGVECAVIEAGMGGRWDATRVAGSVVAGLTNVGTDHQQWLGHGREAVAADKGAALAAARIAVLGPQVDAAIVPHLGAPGAVPAAELVTLARSGAGRVALRWGGHGAEVGVPLAGAHQVDNLHLAVALAIAAEQACDTATVTPVAVRSGLGRLLWPARLSHHRVLGREVVVDSAHNAEGAAALAAHLATGETRFNLLFSCLDDKPVEAMAEALRPIVDRVTVCVLDDPRAMPIERLRAAFPGADTATDPLSALAALPDPVLAAGSLRLAGALLAAEDTSAPDSSPRPDSP